MRPSRSKALAPLPIPARYLHERVREGYVDRSVAGIQLPIRYDFEKLCDTPEDLRSLFSKMGWRHVVAYHT